MNKYIGYTFAIIFTWFLMLMPTMAQQTFTIKGIVKDKKTGEALIGAAVKIKGTSTGAATDFDGNFTLKNIQNLPVVLMVS